MTKIKYFSLKELIKNGLSNEELEKISLEVLKITLPIKDDYPDYKDWFLNKQVKGIGVDRDIIIATYNNEIVGVSSIKGDIEEKKICTLYIKECFRKNRIGLNLVKISCEELETSKPLITISSNKLDEYKKIISKYNWECDESIPNLYRNDTDEYVFNGSLYVKSYSSIESIVKTYKKDSNIKPIIIKLKNNDIIMKLKNLFCFKKVV